MRYEWMDMMSVFQVTPLKEKKHVLPSIFLPPGQQEGDNENMVVSHL